MYWLVPWSGSEDQDRLPPAIWINTSRVLLFARITRHSLFHSCFEWDSSSSLSHNQSLVFRAVCLRSEWESRSPTSLPVVGFQPPSLSRSGSLSVTSSSPGYSMSYRYCIFKSTLNESIMILRAWFMVGSCWFMIPVHDSEYRTGTYRIVPVHTAS